MKTTRLAFGLVSLLAWMTGCSSVKGDSPAGTQPPSPDAGAGADAAPAGTSLADAAGCYLVAQGTSGLVLHSTLLLPSGATAGDLFVDGNGVIQCAAASCKGTAGYETATQIDCDSAVVSPGFINAHDHTTYDADPPMQHGDIRYEHRNDWRTGADGATALPTQKTTSDPATLASIELRFVMSGVTSIVGSGGTAGLARNLAEYQDTSWLEGLTGPPVYFDTFPLGDSNGTVLTSGCAYPSVISASSAFTGGGVFAPHFAEGINTAAENEIECGDSKSIGLVTSKTAVIHAVGTNANDVATIAAAGASVVWAPRSNISLYGDTMPVTEMRDAGVNIALGTDWLPSGSMNELREFACATTMNGKYFDDAFTDQELVAMATSNAANALGFGSQIGSLAQGHLADVVVIATSGAKDFSAPLQASSEDVALVLRGGKPLYGDAELVQAVGGSSCSALSVCNVDKAVCLDVQGVTLDQVQTAIAASYPLYSCRGQTPSEEPTCIPYRDTYPNGTSATDPDGDGVSGTSDDCPMVFNPARPMDDGMQSDLDHDGYGDACDAKPLDGSSH